MITRRQFGKTVGTGAMALGIGEISMGLSCGNIVTDISAYIPVGIAAFNQVLLLVDAPLALALGPIIADIKTGFADLAADIETYKANPSTTLSGKITEILNLLVGNLQSFWSAANLPDGTLAQTIEGVLQIIISTLAAFVPLLGGVLAVKTKKALVKTISVVARTKSQLAVKQVKADINTVFASHGYTNKVY